MGRLLNKSSVASLMTRAMRMHAWNATDDEREPLPWYRGHSADIITVTCTSAAIKERRGSTMELRLNCPFVMSSDRRFSGSLAVMNKLETTQQFDYDDAEGSLAETASVDSSDGVVDVGSFSLPVHETPERSREHMEACACCRQAESKARRGGFSGPPRSSVEVYYTRCQVKVHDSESSCWLVADNIVYDATSLLKTHPGGKECILRKAGGVEDCSLDIFFHSRRGRDMWNRYRIGRLVECGKEPPLTTQWWMFWSKE